MAQRFHPSHWHKLEDPRRLEELPPELVPRLTNVLHHVSDDPQTLAEMVRLLRVGGQLVVFEFGHMERPVGPPAHHVLQHHVLRALVAAMGLREIAYYEPGRLASFHVAMVGEKPAP